MNDEDRWKCSRPTNFELIQVKPNWHNSMDVVGFQSNIPIPHYEFTPFVDFVVKAWCHENTPFFLCLDEMNLAPVEEYFAEFLSAIESRSIGEDGEFETDPIIKPFDSFGSELAGEMMNHFGEMGYDLPKNVETRLRKKGLTLPKNLIVMGTVNMDETTFSFSRKVLDRAMSIEMNEVDYDGFIEGKTEYNIPILTEQNSLFVNRPISAQEVKNGIEVQNVMNFLKGVNDILEGTPFKLGYRAANEAILYVAADKVVGADNLNAALDEFTLMKILSRIEGDDSKLVTKDGDKLLEKLNDHFANVFGSKETSKSLAKLDIMIKTLRRDHFVSFWG
jgi:5-methylcytosine-specific restriction endonuclease McrBC GTP-binding regulatory subunit McrB